MPPRLLEIEITENTYAENFDQSIATVSELRTCSFTVLVDDFDSEYFSLNMLSSTELDILKIDMRFLDMSDHQNTRNSSILESITSTGRWLGLRMIVEGAEIHKQADRLLNLDCEYMQGYYFCKPTNRDRFCELLTDAGRVDVRSTQAKRPPSIDLEGLFHKDITSEAMPSNILGGIALYEIEDDTYLQILMVNDRYYRIVGCDVVDLWERSRLITHQIHPGDMPLVWDILHKVQEAKSMGASGTLRRYRLNGEFTWVHIQAFFLHKQRNRKLFYGSVSDVSTTTDLQKELLATLQTMSGDVLEYQVYPGERLNCRVINVGLSLLYGYTTQGLQDILENGMLEYIDERDHDEMIRIWSNPKQWKVDYSVELRLFTKTDEIIQAERHIRYIREEEGVCICNSLLTDIIKIEKQEDELLKSQHLSHHLLETANQRDSSQQLTKRDKEHATELYAEFFSGGIVGGFCEEGFPLYFANKEMVHFLDYDSYQGLCQGVNGMVGNTIYQEDRVQMELDLGTTFREDIEYTACHHMVRKDGSLIWGQDRECIICEERGHPATISTRTGINEIVKARQLLQKVRQNRQLLR